MIILEFPIIIAQGIKSIVTVIVSSPSPIDVILVTVITVKNERMAARIRMTTVQDGPPCRQILKQHAVPLLVIHIVTIQASGIGVVTELNHRGKLLHLIRPAGFRSVVHKTGLSAIAHQLGNGISLSSGVRSSIIGINHIVPIQLHCRQFINPDAKVFSPVSRQSGHRVRIMPVIHHLGHRRSDASRRTVLAIIDRTLVVIGSVLAPLGCNQRLYRAIVSRSTQSGRLGNAILLGGMSDQPFDLSLVLVQPPLHIGRNT